MLLKLHNFVTKLAVINYLCPDSAATRYRLKTALLCIEKRQNASALYDMLYFHFV